MNSFVKLVTGLSLPLSFINMFGGIFAGIWLATLGEWGLIGYGIAAFLVSGFGIGIAMMPGLLFVAPANALYEKGKKLGFCILGALSTLYTIAVLTIWCIAVLFFFLKQANADSTIPILIWSYGVATGPIVWLAQKEMQHGDEFAMIPTFFAQIAYLLVIIVIFLFRISLLDTTILFGAIMLIGFIFQFKIVSQIEKEVENNSFEFIANTTAENLGMDEQSDYVLESVICSDIDDIAYDMGPNALYKSTAFLYEDGYVSVIYSDPIFNPKDDGQRGIQSFFHLKDYGKIDMLKEAAGESDYASCMVVDTAGKELLSKLKGES